MSDLVLKLAKERGAKVLVQRRSIADTTRGRKSLSVAGEEEDAEADAEEEGQGPQTEVHRDRRLMRESLSLYDRTADILQTMFGKSHEYFQTTESKRVKCRGKLVAAERAVGNQFLSSGKPQGKAGGKTSSSSGSGKEKTQPSDFTSEAARRALSEKVDRELREGAHTHSQAQGGGSPGGTRRVYGGGGRKRSGSGSGQGPAPGELSGPYLDDEGRDIKSP